MDACAAAAWMLSAISRRNAVLNCPASSNDSGGTRRVLVLPGADAFAITAIPQAGIVVRSARGTAIGMASPEFPDKIRGAHFSPRANRRRFISCGESFGQLSNAAMADRSRKRERQLSKIQAAGAT